MPDNPQSYRSYLIGQDAVTTGQPFIREYADYINISDLNDNGTIDMYQFMQQQREQERRAQYERIMALLADQAIKARIAALVQDSIPMDKPKPVSKYQERDAFEVERYE